MMSVPVVKQAIPSSGGGTTGPVGGGPGAGPPSSQSPGKMVTTGPQPGTNILPKNANPGNPMVGPMGGHSVSQSGGISQTLQNSSLMKQVPPTASSMPISMVANHTASAQSMVHQSLSGVTGAGTMSPLSLVQEHRAPSTGVPQPTPPAAHNHPTPPMPTQRGSAPPAHSTAPPSTHPPQSGPSANPMIGSGIDKPKELIVGAKPTSNGVQTQKAGEASGSSQAQQARKVSDGPVSLVVNHSLPEAQGSVTAASAAAQQGQQTHSLATPAPASSVQISPVKPDAAVANHATSQPAKSGLASTAPVANKVSPAPSPVKDKAPAAPTKSVPVTAAPKAPAPSATETNEAPAKSVTPALSSAPQSTTSQATTVKAPAIATSGASPAKPSAPATPAATLPVATSAPSESAASSTLGAGAPEASAATSASPAKTAATPTSSSVPEEPKANSATSSAPAKTAPESQNIETKVTVPAPAEPATPTVAVSADKEGKVTTPASATPARGSKRKRTEIKPPAPTLGSSQAAAIAAASRTPSSKSKIQSDIGSAKKEGGGGEDDDDEERKPKRVRIRTQPYQSPLPELAYLPKFTRTPTSKAQEDKLILFYKNEFLAVRNAEGGFYVCQTMQNIYKHSARIRIRWLSQDTSAPKTDEEKDQSASDGEVYSPDFYDLTDFDCILTNLNLDRLERGKYRLPNVELERTQSILKRALDAEKGLGQKTPLTEEHPDGLDLSLYRDESQLKKRRSPRRKSGTGKGKNSEGGKGKAEDGEEKESSSSSSSSSEDEGNDAEADEESLVKKPKREKRAAPQAQQPSTPRARGGREGGKRKGSEAEGKAKVTPLSAAAASKKRNNNNSSSGSSSSSSTPARKRRSEAATAGGTPAATPATPPARATPARATRSPKSTPTPSRKERSRVKEARKKPGKKA